MRSGAVRRWHVSLARALVLSPLLLACGRTPPNCASLTHMSPVPDWEAEYIRTHPSLISPDEASDIAVGFLRAQGYTREPATVPPNSLSRDIMESSSFEETLSQRRNSVDPVPLGLCRRAGYWLVAFGGTEEARNRRARLGLRTQPTRGRGVLVGIDGRRVRMRHQDLDLKPFDR